MSLRGVVPFALLLTLVLSSSAQALTYPDFATTTGLTLNGSALREGSTLVLTEAANAAASVFTNDPVVDPGTSFSTHFQFSLQGGTTPPGDGIAFVVQRDPRGATALGDLGGTFGYGSIGGAGSPTPISPSLDIEFDIYDNSSDGVADPNANHVAITTNGAWRTAIATGTPAFAMYEDAGLTTVSAWVDYTALTKQLSVFVSNSDVKPAVPVVTATVDLAAVLGGPARAGFTAGTGLFFASQNVNSWSLESDRRPTSTAVTCSPASITPGTTSACAVTVTDTALGIASDPAGTVAFSVTGSGVAAPPSCVLTPTLAVGVSDCQVTFTAGVDLGSMALTGAYAGDANHLSSSGAATIAVVKLFTNGPIALPEMPPRGTLAEKCVFQKKIVGLALVVGCFTNTSGGTLAATGTMLVNGLPIRAKAGTGNLVIDPSHQWLKGSTDKTVALVYLPTPGFAAIGGPIDGFLLLGSLMPRKLKVGGTALLMLTPAAAPTALAQIVLGKELAAIRGVVLKTNLVLRSIKHDTLQLVGAAAAPNYLGGVSGDLELRISPTSVSGSFKLPGAYLGPPGSPGGRIGIEDVDLAFDASKAGLSWDGKAALRFGVYRLAGHMEFDGGGLRTLRVDANVGVPGQQPVLSLGMNGYFLPGSGWLINGNGQLALTRIGGTPFLSAQGTLQLSGNGQAVLLRGSAATLRVLNDALALGGGSFELSSAGSLAVTGSASLGNASAGINATFSGWAALKPTPAFNLEGSGTVHVLDENLNGTALISSTGYGACASMNITVLGKTIGSARVGFGRKWGASLDVIASSCDLGKYRATAATAHAAGGPREVDLPAGLPLADLAVRGSGAAPHVELTDPRGRKIVPVSGTSLPGGGALALTDTAAATTHVLLPRPTAGLWKITEADGSPPITDVRVADGLPEPRVRAKVLAGGGRRELLWSLKPLRGQTVRFVSSGAGGDQPIGSGSSARGRVFFTPRPGAGGRKVKAIVEQDGVPRRVVVVASYTAAAHPLLAPLKVTARRHGAGVELRWTRVPGAARYRVRLTIDGRKVERLIAARRLSLPSAGRRAGNATVQALDESGRRGRESTVRIPAAR